MFRIIAERSSVCLMMPERGADDQSGKGAATLSAWTPEAIASIASTDDFHLAPYREDGVTPGTLIWVWSVVVDEPAATALGIRVAWW
jgi:hypothetical protein